ncbi:MAG TPA: nitroreductase family deazaflavin-dependent oxidoreductase [Pseudonocardia sp.]|nr:nitroreductase family deazaflavin-dependent oxidoreductase [Pseudonocardia sp.]
MATRRAGVPARWLKPTNRVLMAIQRSGLGLRELPVLTVPGRRTGQPRRTPLTVLEHEGQRYVLQGYPHTDWVANLRAAGHVATLTVGRRTERVRFVELPPAEALPILRAWPVRIPHGAKVMKDAGVVDDVTPDSFAGLVGTLAVFRIDPPG